MQIVLIAVGRQKPGAERTLVQHYLKRSADSGRNLSLSGFHLTEINQSTKSSAALRKSEEAKNILAALPKKSFLIALDERGKSQNSEKFASNIARLRDEGHTALVFTIGGADGLHKNITTRADSVLNFSPLTWPHQLVRIMLAEQIYRATTILAGHPYHRA